MSRSKNGRSNNGQFPLGVGFSPNSPYDIGAVPTPRLVRAWRRKRKKFAKDFILYWNERVRRIKRE